MGNSRVVAKRAVYTLAGAIAAAGIGLGVAAALALPAMAHDGGLAKDGCHKDSSMGSRHCHMAPYTVDDDGAMTITVPAPPPIILETVTTVEVPVERIIENVVEVPIDRIVERVVQVQKPTTEACDALREQFWNYWAPWDRVTVASEAIATGCW